MQMCWFFYHIWILGATFDDIKLLLVQIAPKMYLQYEYQEV